MDSAMLSDDLVIAVAQMEIACELLGGGLANITAIALLLFVREKVNWHRKIFLSNMLMVVTIPEEPGCGQGER